MGVAEKRGGEFGYAEPISWLKYWGIVQSTRNGPEPKPEKFEGKWFGGEDAEGADELVIAMHAKRREENEEWYDANGYKTDNVFFTKNCRLTSQSRHPLFAEGPVFTDWVTAPYAVSYDRMKWTFFLQSQYAHCVGSLGEEHPTCQKAAWYKAMGTPSVAGAWYEETEELGHWDTTKKWGIKPHGSFLPVYQPVKTKIPGAYEFYRSKTYLESYEADGSGETSYPFVYCE